MNADTGIEDDEEALETDRQATSMQDQLSKEVLSWSKERRDQTSETVITPSQPVMQRRSHALAGEAKKLETRRPIAKPSAGKPAGTRSQPFSMSYGGMTQSEYIQYLRDRGLR